MAGVLDTVNQRTQMAGENRLELLLFSLQGKQRYGINVFKVQEVIQCPPLTQVPHSHPVVKGVSNMRDKTITIIDLAKAIGQPSNDDMSDAYVIITEYNRRTQGFLVHAVERIINMKWADIQPPPKGTGNNYMTAVTKVDDNLVEIIDVEKVMAEVMEVNNEVADDIAERRKNREEAYLPILVVDDSSVARNQIKRTLDQLNIGSYLAKDGRQALEMLKGWADEGKGIDTVISMIISDVEMPEMDGYTLTTSIRSDERLKNAYIVLHTSLSGVFNNALVEKVGANKFIAKFDPNELAEVVLGYLEPSNNE